MVYTNSYFRKDPQDFAFPQQDKAELAFRLMDKDRDGRITKKEMVKAFKNLSMDQVDNVMPVIIHQKLSHFPLYMHFLSVF